MPEKHKFVTVRQCNVDVVYLYELNNFFFTIFLYLFFDILKHILKHWKVVVRAIT